MMGRSTIPFAIIIAGIIVALTLYFSAPEKLEGNPSLVRPVGIADHILGNPAAKVVIIEYSDFDCQFCKSFHDTLHQIIANEGADGEVAWVLRHFPLTELHEGALPLARASECAAQVAGNEGFWRFADMLFKNQPVSPARLGEIAAAANIPTTAFATCYASAGETFDERIMADRENAFAIGADGTPYSIILSNGGNIIVMDNAYTYDMVSELVDRALGK